MKFVATLLLLTCSMAIQNAPAQTKPVSALDKPTLEAYLRYSELWIPQVTVTIDDPKPSATLNNFLDVKVHLSFNGQTKDEMYYVSKDGRNVIKGAAYDIGKSPFQANIDMLKPDQQPSFGAGDKAVVNMIVFGDFQCPVCQKEETDLRANLPAAFGDKVRVYFVDFPLTSIHPWALKGSVYGRCMYHQGQEAFWNYHDWIYANQKEVTLENVDAKVKEFAMTKKIDMAKVNACVEDQTGMKDVERAVNIGHNLEVSATPTMFLNGRKLEGALPWETLSALLQIEIDHQAQAAKTTAQAGAKDDDKCCTVDIPTIGGGKKTAAK